MPKETFEKMVYIGPGSSVKAPDIWMGKRSRIGKNTRIFCPGGFHIGKNCVIGDNVEIRCWSFKAGDYLFTEDNVIVGGGGSLSSAFSRATLGDHVFIGRRCVLNTSCELTVGDRVAFGAGANIWTHGAYLSYLDGFPAKFAKTRIGNDVWIQGMSQVMPGVTIEDRCVVAMGSIVAKSVPTCSFVGGNPARIIERQYQLHVFDMRRLEEMVEIYKASAQWRDLPLSSLKIVEEIDGPTVRMELETGHADFCMRHVETRLPELARSYELTAPESAKRRDEMMIDDFADFCRRFGVRFNTGRPYRSIPHPAVTALEDADS